MNKTVKIVLIAILAFALGLVAARFIFDEQYSNLRDYMEARDNYEGDKAEFDRNFERYIDARENYDGDPEEFDRKFQKMVEFIENYQEQNPDASEEEAIEAFRRLKN